MRINEPEITLRRADLVVGDASPAWERYRTQFRAYFEQSRATGEFEEFPHVVPYPCLGEDTTTTSFDRYYYYQDTWAARKIFQARPEWFVDVGSTVLLSGIISQFVPCTFVDIRPIEVTLPGLTSLPGSILELPFTTGSVPFLSSLCVVEHIGLGRYGDPIGPHGTRMALREIDRVLKPGGELLLSTNVGPACIAFNAHRIFDLDQLMGMLPGYEIVDEVFLDPEPRDRSALAKLEPGEFVVWVAHLRKRSDDHRRRDQELAEWRHLGCPNPPPHSVKVGNVCRLREALKLQGLLETGTYLGAMVDAVRQDFRKVASIELQGFLAQRATDIFALDAKVKIFQGDSGARLNEALDWLDCESLLWLDRHWSGGFTAQGNLDTPVIEELRKAAARPEIVKAVLVDDARCFVGQNGYPTIAELSILVGELFPGHRMDVVDDSIRILPESLKTW